MLRSNQNAATLAVLAEVILGIAVFLPFMSVTKLGQKETYSLLGGIGELWRHGDALLAIVIGVFSLAFPLIKNVLLIAATTSFWDLTPAHRRTLHALSAKTAKYSMLDVFVAAVLVVVVKLGKSTDVEILSGTLLFCLAIALSMAASACVRFEEAA